MSFLVVDSPFGYHIFEGPSMESGTIDNFDLYTKQVSFFEFPNSVYGAMIINSLEKQNKIHSSLEAFLEEFLQKEQNHQQYQWFFTSYALEELFGKKNKLTSFVLPPRAQRALNECIYNLLSVTEEEYNKKRAELTTEMYQFVEME